MQGETTPENTLINGGGDTEADVLFSRVGGSGPVATTYCNIWPAIDGCARHVELQKPFFTPMQEIRELLLLYIDGCALHNVAESLPRHRTDSYAVLYL